MLLQKNRGARFTKSMKLERACFKSSSIGSKSYTHTVLLRWGCNHEGGEEDTRSMVRLVGMGSRQVRGVVRSQSGRGVAARESRSTPIAISLPPRCAEKSSNMYGLS